MAERCMDCRWWNRHGNARAIKNDTGSCMLQYRFGDAVPNSHAQHRAAHERCDFYGRSGEVYRDYLKEFAAHKAAAEFLDKVVALRT